MSEKEIELVKNCEFSEIYFDDVLGHQRVYVDGKQLKKGKTISVFAKNIESMNEKELFDYIMDLFMTTGDIISQRKVMIPHLNKQGIILVNSNGKVIYISDGITNMDDTTKFLCDNSRFKGMTDKIDQAVENGSHANISIITSEDSSVYSTEIFDSYNLNKENRVILNLNSKDICDRRILNYAIRNFVKASEFNMNYFGINIEDYERTMKLVSEKNNILKIKGKMIDNIDYHILNDLSKSIGNKGYQRQITMGDVYNGK